MIFRIAQTPTLPKAAPEVRALLERALAAHGGNALKELRTMKEMGEMTASGPLGMRAPSQQMVLVLDRPAASGRWQGLRDNKPMGVYQQTPSGVALWTEKLGTQRLSEADAPFAYVPVNKTALVGLLALQTTTDALSFVERGEIKGKKGPMIVRTQAAPKETLLIAGKGEMLRALCQTTWAYLFALDGTLIAERITQTEIKPNGEKRVFETQMSYDRFETVSGIKFPIQVSVKLSGMPSMVSVKMKVKSVAVNAPIAKTEFAMP